MKPLYGVFWKDGEGKVHSVGRPLVDSQELALEDATKTLTSVCIVGMVTPLFQVERKFVTTVKEVERDDVAFSFGREPLAGS